MANLDPEPVSPTGTALRGDWGLVATEPAGPWLRATAIEPGPIALRARWHYLRGLGDEPRLGSLHCIDDEQWQREIDLESEGDLALVRQATDIARERFERLRQIASHPLGQVQALIGLADAARQDDDMAAAEGLYREAGSLAAEIGFEFGVLRARLPLAHLVRRSGSAEEMLAIASECEALARRLSDQVYVANALVARGEALDLLARRDEAVKVLVAAMREFAEIGTDVGIASAGLRLLDVHRRREDADAILRLAPRVMRAIEATQQLQEAVDVYDVLAYAYVKRREYADAVDACRKGIALAEPRYPRAAAHLRMTEGLALRKSRQPLEAAAVLVKAYDYFGNRAGDEVTAAHCLGHLADCAEDFDSGEAVELRLRAMDAVEQTRSRQSRPRWQQEYRERFDTVYRGALLTMIRAGDASAFAAVFESLWGRRLPGVTEGVRLDPTADPLLIAQLLARQDQAQRAGITSDPHGSHQLPRDPDPSARNADLPALYADATDPALAASYRPLTREQGLALLDGISPDIALLLIAEVPGRRGRVGWLARAPHSEPVLGQHELTTDELTLIDAFSERWPTDAAADAAAPLSRLLPPEIADLPAGTPLQLVPLERLWSLPWSALPVSGGYLGAAVDLLLSPSLTLARTSGRPLGPARSPGTATLGCIGPGVLHHDLHGLGKESVGARTTEAATLAHAALLDGDTETVVVVAHGRPAPGLGHYLEMAPDRLLTPAELLAGTPPTSVALVACWGAQVPGPTTGEPLTLATITLARGSRQVLSTVNELGDSASAAGLVNSVIARGAVDPWPKALRWALHRRLDDLPDEPLVNWAALVAIGGW
ncbi:MAG: hypothetical protein QM619_08825 [Micropruina sp.]|uniref:hypothetical protein n=1 Tax=Micropruina sp. TaxID=2737536 RepID=UPI0039E445AE